VSIKNVFLRPIFNKKYESLRSCFHFKSRFIWIQNKQSGFYNLIDFKAANTTVNLFETELKRDERVMRYLNVKLDKHADAWSVKRRERNTKKA